MLKVVPKDAVLTPDHAKRVFKGVIFDVYQWQQKLFDGSEVTFEMLRRPETLIVIGVVDGKITVLQEVQPHVGDRSGFPGGRLDPEDNSTLDAAKREMLEETGYTFKSWRLIDVRQPIVKAEWFVNVYLATDAEQQQETQHDPGEKITLKLLPFEQVKDMCLNDVGILGREGKTLFEELGSLEDLLALPEFEGQEVDR